MGHNNLHNLQDKGLILNFLKQVCQKMNIKIDPNLDIKSPNEKASTILKYHIVQLNTKTFRSSVMRDMLKHIH